MQVLQWAASYPERVFSALPIATGARHSSQNIAFHEVGRQAVMADPDWRGGRYYEAGISPRKGLAVARMAAHITYLSDEALHRKFGRNLQDRDKPTFGFDADFQIESYLRHQGSTFVDRFDANSYLYMTRAMDYFDLAADYGGRLANAFLRTDDALLRRLVHLRLAVPDGREQGGRARAERGRRQRLVRRDRDRPRPRRLPARRAGAVRHHPRLPSVGRRSAGAVSMNAALGPASSAAPAASTSSPSPSWSSREAACSTSAVATASCSSSSRRPARVDGRGIEISQKGVNECVARGLSVVQGDADSDLVDYPDNAFDYVILSQTLQATRRPRVVLEEMLRIGRKAIVSFPNFGHWRVRTLLGFTGKMPVTAQPARRLVRDAQHPLLHDPRFRRSLRATIDAKVENAMVAEPRRQRAFPFKAPLWFWNLFGQQAVFVLKR